MKQERFISVFSVLIFLALWQAASLINPKLLIFISSPARILAEGLELVSRGNFWVHVTASLTAFSLGFFPAVILAVAAGLVIGYYKKIFAAFKPHVFVLSSLPMAALAPLFIIWFGIGLAAKAAIVFLMALPPVLVNTIDGTKNADKELIKMAKSFGAGDLTVLKNVIFFSALPFIFSGSRLAVGRAVIGLVISEVFGYGKGLGFLVSFYGSTFQVGRLMFVIMLLLGFNMAMISLINLIKKLTVRWEA